MAFDQRIEMQDPTRGTLQHMYQLDLGMAKHAIFACLHITST